MWCRAAKSGAAVIKVLGKRSGKLCSIASTLTLNLGLCSPVGAVWCHLTGRVLSDKSCGAGDQVNCLYLNDSDNDSKSLEVAWL